MISDSGKGDDPLESLLDDFASRCRRGESPSPAEYAAQHPEHARRIETLFPAVAAMEQFRSAERTRRQALARQGTAANPPSCLGDFRVLREIGRGGMGIVYEALQQSLARSVAVKVLPRHVLLLDKHLERFQHEARTAARLHHTNIVEVFGVGEHEGLHYYVMPLVRGVGLDEVIRELRAMQAATSSCPSTGRAAYPTSGLRALIGTLTTRKFAALPSDGCAAEEKDPGEIASTSGAREPWWTIARIGLQAAEAIEYAHAQGVLHRDLKPGNLLLDENGTVFVADFGLARAMDGSAAGAGSDCVGTASYMAPEQLRGSAADCRSDIYALGLTLYELLTLRPASGDPAATGSLKIERARPAALEPPRKVYAAIPRDLDAIVLMCAEHLPVKRYQAAADLAADLRRFLEDRPVRARRVLALERAARWCRRNPALAAVSALALLLLVALAGTALAGYLHTARAYAETRRALDQAEATSTLALDVLDGIYARLSPERVWIACDSDPAGQACACIGLSTGDRAASSVERTMLETRASGQTAALLENLLVFYDRLAAQGGEDDRVMLQSAVACRRLGDMRLCLGQMDRAEQDYLRAVEKLGKLSARAPADIEIATELARNHNELGNVWSARREVRRACQSHQAALEVLRGSVLGGRTTVEYRYELARTQYFLAGKSAAAPADAAGATATSSTASPPASRPRSVECRKAAIRILEELTRENPHAPDSRLLLALCYRESSGSDSAVSPRSAPGRRQAIELLEGLAAAFPEVADYRYELMATYAWFPVSLFPWQGRFSVSSQGEQDLRKALDHSKALVASHPRVPHYARAHALILAKLAVACWRSQRLAEAEESFQKAVQAQGELIDAFSGLPARDRVLLDFFRVRLAQVGLERNAPSRNRPGIDASRKLLEGCADRLVELKKTPALADDQLLQTTLPLAYDLTGEVLAAAGEPQKAAEAKRKAQAIRSEVRGKSKTAMPLLRR